MMSAAEVAAWAAIAGVIVGLFIQIYNLIRQRNKEQTELKEALDKAPLVRQQLELGNVGGAVGYLNSIIVSQAEHIDRQDSIIDRQEERIEELEREVLELRLQLFKYNGGGFNA